MGITIKQTKLSGCVEYRYTPTTSNLDATCEEIAKRGITYAQWQKERYSTLYDVKSHIEKYKRRKRALERLGYKIKWRGCEHDS